MNIDTSHFERCINTLEKAHGLLLLANREDIEYDMYRSADVFRQAVLRSIISSEICERFLEYRENRSNTAHDYGVNFAEETLILLPQFIKDSRLLAQALKEQNDATAE